MVRKALLVRPLRKSLIHRHFEGPFGIGATRVARNADDAGRYSEFAGLMARLDQASARWRNKRGRLAAQHKICGLRSQRGSLEYGPVVAPQDFQPGAKIISVTNGRDDTQFGAEKRCAKFRHKLLTSIGVATALPGKVSVEPRDVASPMTIMPISA